MDARPAPLTIINSESALGAKVLMAEDWIARSIAGVAAVAAVVNAYFNHQKHKSDRDAKLPQVAWHVTRKGDRQFDVMSTVANERKTPIRARCFAIFMDGTKFIGSDPDGQPSEGISFIDGLIDPGQKKDFFAQIVIADEYIAPVPTRLEIILMIDLCGGEKSDHFFFFDKNVY